MFCGPVRVPANARHGLANVKLSMPDWTEGNVTPGTIRGLIIGEAKDASGIAAALETSSSVACRDIMDAVGRFGPFDADNAKVLIKQTKSDDLSVRAKAIRTLTKFEEHRAIITPTALSLIKDPAEYVRSSALRAFGQLEQDVDKKVSVFMKAMVDESVSVRRVAVYELAKEWASRDEVLAELTKVLDDEDAYIRKYATRGLGLVPGKTPTSFAVLVKLLKDTNEQVRSDATAAIIQHHRDRIPEVIEGLGDTVDESHAKTALACEALKQHGAHIVVASGKPFSFKIENKAKITAEDLRYVRELKDLRSFIVYNSPVGDEMVAHLMNLPKLEYVVLWNSEITDRAVEQLSAKSSIERLGVGGNKNITDAAMTSIKNMPQLTLLSLGFTQISDEGMKAVANLTNLTFLGVAQTKVTDEGLTNLKKLTRLTQLNIFGNDITSHGLQNIAHLKELKSLEVQNTSIDDSAIEYISELQSLTRMTAKNTKITAAGFAKIRKAIPRCKIQIQP